MGRTTSIIIILCLLLVPAGLLTLGGLSDNSEPTSSATSTREINTLSYESHEPFSIWSDAEFASLADEEGWSGSGTHESPYVIEGYQIQAVSHDSCIEIQDAESHFVIRNCDLSSGGNALGVHLDRAPNGRIESCFIHSVYLAVYVSLSSGITVYNNTLFDTIGGIALVLSSGCVIESNHLTNCSLEILASGPDQWLHNVTGNYVNEKQLGYFRNVSETTIDASSLGQVILVQCQHVIVRDGVFYGIGTGISLAYCQGCCIIDCESTDNSLGLYTDYSSDGLINSCMIRNNDFGIWLNQSSSFWNVSGNTAYHNAYAGFVAQDSSLMLMGNSILYSATGVWLLNSSESYLYDNGISNNAIGALVTDSSNVTFEANTISHNTERGLNLGYDCEGCSVYYNQFFSNGIENARDDGGPNTWDNGNGMGNYWSDYSGSGVYNIPGSAGSIDRYPRQMQYTTTVPITNPTDPTSSSNTGIWSLGIGPTMIAVGSVAAIVMTAYTLVRSRGPRGYQ